MIQSARLQPDAVAPRNFQCRDEIGVVGHNDDSIDVSIERQRRHIDADAHVDAFLLEAQLVIRSDGWSYDTFPQLM